MGLSVIIFKTIDGSECDSRRRYNGTQKSDDHCGSFDFSYGGCGACGKMMGDAPVPAEKAGVSSGDRKAPADSTEKAEAGTADTEKNEKEKQKNR